MSEHSSTDYSFIYFIYECSTLSIVNYLHFIQVSTCNIQDDILQHTHSFIHAGVRYTAMVNNKHVEHTHQFQNISHMKSLSSNHTWSYTRLYF